LYGGAYAGGLYQAGTLFKVTPQGQFTTVYNFCAQVGCADGINPFGPFLLGMDGNFYGTAWWGGTADGGVLFKMTPGGQVTTVHNFCATSECPDGEYPWGGLIQDYQGNIYGANSAGGANGSYGTVFQLPPNGELKGIYSFCALSGCDDGRFPIASLVVGPSLNLYGATHSGGTHGQGTVFKLTPSGSLKTIHAFCAQSGCPDGAVASTLVMGSDGNLYGTTNQGGAMNEGTFFKLSLPSGQLDTLYSFCSLPSCADGAGPFSMIQATDGNFYGITRQGPGANSGTLFEITPSGSLTVLHTFCSAGDCSDGKLPSTGGLVQHTNGIFYGVLGHGGNVTSNGTIFSLSTGLAPFVIPVPATAMAGAAVQILSDNLTGTTKVTFGGKAAKFNVVSSTEIMTNVPAGAKSGPVEVVTPGGTLSSNVSFKVVP
jgi:uncharacterized repeat protein (TIGR03803 family)